MNWKALRNVDFPDPLLPLITVKCPHSAQNEASLNRVFDIGTGRGKPFSSIEVSTTLSHCSSNNSAFRFNSSIYPFYLIINTKVDIRGATSENMPVKSNMIIDIIVLITKTAQSPIMLSVRDI